MSLLKSEIKGKVAWVAFNRPEKMNALSHEMTAELAAILEDLKSNDEVSVVVLYGEGKAFSSGADLSGPRPSERRRALDDWLRLEGEIDKWLSPWRFPKPVISAVHGYVMGPAIALVVCTDVTVIANDAVVGWPGLPLGGGQLGPSSMVLIGPKKAKELSFTWGRMSGEEAVQWGWANYAVPADEVLSKAEELAVRMAQTPVELLKVKKAALNRVMEMQGFLQIMKFGAQWDALAHDSDAVDEWRGYVKADGMKEALARFRTPGGSNA